ncbi:doublecortin domain-containing protein 2-like [Hoplias malabaricus]|uniref:doublecortin domain-containing protein 2-like n=1 Tax=Hoplias malabaricus TaxID=27720 RepID=UPI00346251F2
MPGLRSSVQAQPAVKSIVLYRNGQPGRGRRVVLHEKRVSSLEALLSELSGGARRLHTPHGHRVEALHDIQHRGTYVAAGTESFRKIDYLQVNRNKGSLQSNQPVKPAPQNRNNVTARFLQPIKEPCTIFVVANGDVLNPAVRFLVHNRLLGQFERILEMVTEKMGLRVLGGVHSLYTFDGVPVMDGKELENGQFYVAVGRDKFKRLPYADLLFTKPMGIRRVVRSKAASLPPIYGFRRQNGDLGNCLSKSTAGCGESGETKTSPPAHKPMSSLVREISQARLVTLRKKRSGLTMSLSAQENDDSEQKTEEEDEESGEKELSEEPSAPEQEKAEGEEEIPESDETAQTAEEAETTEEGVVETEEGAVEAEESAVEAEESAVEAEESAVEAEESAVETEESAVETEEGVAETEEGVAETEEEEKTGEEGEGEGEEVAENDKQPEEDEGQGDESAANAEGEEG